MMIYFNPTIPLGMSLVIWQLQRVPCWYLTMITTCMILRLYQVGYTKL